MIQESYNLFLTQAENIEGWRDLDKSELVNKYIEHENDKNDFYRNSYMAAIICRYWPKIQRFYKATPIVSTYEEIYDILINSILRAIKARRWLDKDSTIYDDPNGPDKAINRTMMCERLNFLIYKNRSKRVVDIGAMSIEESQEKTGDVYFNLIEDSKLFNDVDRFLLLKNFYDDKMYVLMFVYDTIMNFDCMKDGEFSSKICTKYLLTMDDGYLGGLASEVDCDLETMKKIYNDYILEKKSTMKYRVENAIYKLREFYYKEEI